MSSADWTPEAHDTIPELEPDYQPVRSHWATLQDKLDHATLAQLQQMARGGIGEPDAHT